MPRVTPAMLSILPSEASYANETWAVTGHWSALIRMTTPVPS
ncbi:hypothetical protein SAMN04489742_0948 [Arthrobacter crystallopoietes]|uniref:Uncharacterized protein n=1 Tax=Crystallibacter crystallopoietes TaxID=37928 RepID=A0A1H1AJD4_9MICC|nr:hypothetical protein SAMN04489742_0948 [Arthrobacter crystallopoietes]